MIKCPVCSEYDFIKHNDFDDCEVCDWENDGIQYNNPNFAGGANKMSLNEARTAWNAIKIKSA